MHSFISEDSEIGKELCITGVIMLIFMTTVKNNNNIIIIIIMEINDPAPTSTDNLEGSLAVFH